MSATRNSWKKKKKTNCITQLITEEIQKRKAES